jgi:acetoin utilization deacetylase AcuC-like enzyme
MDIRLSHILISGFQNERGNGAGYGYNFNFPLKEEVNRKESRVILEKTLNIIRKFKPEFLIIALGLDTGKGDPTGTWTLSGKDFNLNGKMTANLRLPTLIIQEGDTEQVPRHQCKSFFKWIL